MILTVTSWCCESVGGFDWFYKREDALAAYEDNLKDETLREVFLFSHTTDKTQHVDINHEIDMRLDEYEQGAERFIKRQLPADNASGGYEDE